jgi:hypothetical protein
MGCLLSRQGEAGGVAGVPATPPPARLALPFIDAMDSGKLCMPILGKYFRLLQQRFYSLPNRVMNTVCSKFAFEMVAFAVVAWRCGCGTRETPTSRPATPNYPCSISTASESTGGQTWAFLNFLGVNFWAFNPIHFACCSSYSSGVNRLFDILEGHSVHTSAEDVRIGLPLAL